MLKFTRGSSISFLANSFLDADGASMTPSSVTVYIDYPGGTDCRADASVTLSNAGGNWTGQWESEVAYPGRVYYSVKAVGTDDVAIDGEFQLSANQANPDP